MSVETQTEREGFYLRFKREDKDINAWMNAQGNIAESLRVLIREHIKNNGNNSYDVLFLKKLQDTNPALLQTLIQGNTISNETNVSNENNYVVTEPTNINKNVAHEVSTNENIETVNVSSNESSLETVDVSSDESNVETVDISSDESNVETVVARSESNADTDDERNDTNKNQTNKSGFGVVPIDDDNPFGV